MITAQELQTKIAEVEPLRSMTRMILDGRRAEWNEELILFEMAWPWRDIGNSLLDAEVTGLLTELTNQGRAAFLMLYHNILDYAVQCLDDAKGKWDLPVYREDEKTIDFIIDSTWVKSEAVFYEHIEAIKKATSIEFTQGQIDYLAGLSLARREGHKRQLGELKTAVQTLENSLTEIFVSNDPEHWKKFSEAAANLVTQFNDSDYALEKSRYPEFASAITFLEKWAAPVGHLVSPEAEADWKKVAPPEEKVKKPRKKKAKAEENPSP